MERKLTKRIQVGPVAVGGGAPVSIQSMLNTRTTDVEGSLAQIRALAAAGCEIARLAVPDMQAAEAFGEICQASPLPLVADIHFDYRLALEAAERGIENVQILSPFREKGEAASEQLNCAIRERVNPFRSAEEEVKIGSRTFRVHDRVMQTKNTEKVSNGDLGFITGITTGSKGERLVQMDFGGDRKMNYTAEQLAHVDLAYATTIHKAMGSEFETVIIPIVKAHSIMLYRNLLYTAMTRAKKKVILVGHKPILFMAVHRADISKRNTMLGERIRLYCKAYHTERNALPELQQAG